MGTSASGSVTNGNNDGIQADGSSNNEIGGADPADRNLISLNNDDGIDFRNGASVNIVRGNLIGTDLAGVLDQGNSDEGIEIRTLSNKIGGSGIGDRNLISGNGSSGIELGSRGTNFNIVQGNWIGLQVDGTSPLGNGANGVAIVNGLNNVIGGTGTGVGNTVAFNGGDGVAIGEEGIATGNTIRGNSIHSNIGSGIDLGPDGSTPNDLGQPPDSDGGANNRQNFPLLNSATSGVVTTSIFGSLRSTPSTTFDIEFFQELTPDPSGFGEGRRFIGTTQVTTNVDGLATIGELLFFSVSTGALITATATDPNGNTSEFSNAVAVEHLIEVADFGDAPSPTFPTRLQDDGARHLIVSNFTLGQVVDEDADGIPSTDATGDDSAGQVDDEEGVTGLDTPLVPRSSTNITVNVQAAGGNGLLNAWLDFNRDGDWADANEKIFSNLSLPEGANNLSFAVPSSAGAGTSFARFRWVSPGHPPLSFSGGALDGEVEDYQVTIACSVVVTTTGDTVDPTDGVTSLREAILCSNNTPGKDTITFDFLTTGPVTIVPQTDLPPITDPAIVDGLSKPGSNCTSATPFLQVELDGSQAGADANGLTVIAGDSTIRGLVINRFSQHGIELLELGGNVIECNFIGLNISGSAGLGNVEHGVFVNNTPNNRIGGPTHIGHNVISGNGEAGISIVGTQASGNTVLGNFIGTNASGTEAIGNAEGIEIYNATNNVVGAETPVPGTGPGNVISGNLGVAIEIASGVVASAANNRIFGNIIGLNAVGDAAIANSGQGVLIRDARQNVVGSATQSQSRNVISANRGEGVLIQEGVDPTPAVDNEIANNFIGTDISGTANFGNTAGGVHLDGSHNRVERNVIAFNSEFDTGVSVSGNDNSENLITANSMFSNDGLGINLAGGTQDANGVTLNDAGDGDTGPNGLLNFPILESAVITSGNLTVSGFAPLGSIIELFVAAADPSGFGEGQIFLIALDEGSGDDLDATTGTYGPGPVNGLQQGTDTTNRFRLTIPTPAGVTVGTLLTATATDEFQNTSEFSGNLSVTSEVFDFSDAPETYHTTLTANGPRHRLGSALFLGTSAATDVDAEQDGQPSPFADADEINGQFDERGISSQPTLFASVAITPGTTATAFVTASTSGFLDAFLDFNDDGDFADSGERIFSGRAVVAGINSLQFNVPAAATGGVDNVTFSRWRISSQGELSFTGQAPDGEVEDHAVDVVAPTACSLIVTTTNDAVSTTDGVNSLREAILCSNNTEGKDTITFNIPTTGPATISPQTPLPSITDPAIIDGPSQPGSNCGSTVPVLQIELNGSQIGAGANGLTVTAGDTTIRGLVINRFSQHGIELLELGGNVVECNFIGLNVNGSAGLGNGGHGVFINNTPNNQIGRATPVVLNGGETLAARNAISGNGQIGVFVLGPQATGNVILDNLIGTDVGGTADIGNATGGVQLVAAGNRVERNVIAFNSDLDAETGVAVSGETSTANLITANSMFFNDGLGINLLGGAQDGNGVTLNDAGDADNGPNGLLNFPILESTTIATSNLTVSGFAPPGSIIELFVAAADPSGFGEGQTFLATLTEGSVADLDATTGTYGPGAINGLQQGSDTTNRFRFTIPVPVGVALGTLLTATATDANQNTSEFSGNVAVTEVFDFGDAPDTYSTSLAGNGARHALNGPFLGNSRDAELDGQPSTGATGDDVTGEPDDEDGVILGDLTQGANTNVTVFSSGNTAALDAFIDFNLDGDFADQGEKIFSSQRLTAGNNVLPFAVPAAAVVGNTFARFRISFEGGLTFNGPASDGEVEDYSVRILAAAPVFDFGDAPDSYQTTLAANGARHRVGSTVFFGTSSNDLDAEPDGQPSAFADADQLLGEPDERGVSGENLFSELNITPGGTATAVAIASVPGLLDAFIDFNADGDFADSGEQIFSSRPLIAGQNGLQFNVPAAARGREDGTTISRWRISSAGGLSFTGEAPDGEVEDLVAIVAVPAASISGTKFLDINGNGNRDEDENGLAGVTIFLDADDDGELDSPEERATTTAAFDPESTGNQVGSYSFMGINPGSHIVCEVTPPNTIPTLPRGTIPCFTVTVAPGQQLAGLDFGNQPIDPNASSSFAGFVYADVNDNGIKDPTEMGLPNVNVTLTGPVTRTLATDSTGAYRFLNLPTGNYTVTESQPSAFQDGKEAQGAPALGEVDNDAFLSVHLAGNVNAVDYNFGERGLLHELISKRLFLASTPVPIELLESIQVVGEGEWITFQAITSGYLYAQPAAPGAVVEFYSSSFLPLGMGAPGQPLSIPVAEGEKVMLYVQSDQPLVALDLRILEADGNPSQSLKQPIGQAEGPTLFNVRDPLDVSGDGTVTSFDALLILNELNGRRYSDRFGRIAVTQSNSGRLPSYDTNHDGLITPNDTLRVFNALNGKGPDNEADFALSLGDDEGQDDDSSIAMNGNASRIIANYSALTEIVGCEPQEESRSRSESVDRANATIVDRALAEYLAEIKGSGIQADIMGPRLFLVPSPRS